MTPELGDRIVGWTCLFSAGLVLGLMLAGAL